MILILLTIAASFLASLFVTPMVRDRAIRYGIVDLPDNDRKLHTKSTPLCGGVAVFIAAAGGVCFAFLVGGAFSPTLGTALYLWPLAAASLVIMMVGIADDILHLRARQKLAGQLVAVGVLLLGGMRIEMVELFGMRMELGILAIVLTAFWLLTAINAVNLLDGADGFAGSIGLVIALTSGVMLAWTGRWEVAVVAFALAGSLAGFLVFNFPPSSIFLGDTGSMLIGLVIGALAIQGSTKAATTVTLLTPLALLALPLMDTTAAMIRRVVTRRGLAMGDRAHLHHAMQRKGWGPRRMVAAAILLSLITASGALLSIVQNDDRYAIASVVILLGMLIGGRIFGFNELRLISSRGRSFLRSLVPADKQQANRRARQQRVGLLDSQQGEELWQKLTEFADQNRLSRIRMDLEGSWMADGHDVLWEQIRTDAAIENWSVELPIQLRSRRYGKLAVAGTVAGDSGQHLLRPLAELLDSVLPSLDEIISDAANHTLARSPSKRVLVIGRSYWPDVGTYSRLVTDLCETLADHYDLSILTGQPRRIRDRESFEVSGIQRRNRVKIQRVRHLRIASRGLARRTINYTSFALSALWRSYLMPTPDVVIETDPMPLALFGGLFKQWNDGKLILYIKDIDPVVATCLDERPRRSFYGFLRGRLLGAFDRADRIIVTNGIIRHRLIQVGVKEQKIFCAAETADPETIFPVKHDNQFRLHHGLQGKFVVMFSGNMNRTQRLDRLILCANRLRFRSDIEFVLVGDGECREELQRISRGHELNNISFVPYQPTYELGLTLSAADLHFVTIDPEQRGDAIPSKLQGVMASGTPVLAIVPESCDVAETIRSEQIGFTLPPDEDEILDGTILKCANGIYDLEAMGVFARKLAESRFDRHRTIDTLAEAIEEFMQPSGAMPSETRQSTLAATTQ